MREISRKAYHCQPYFSYEKTTDSPVELSKQILQATLKFEGGVFAAGIPVFKSTRFNIKDVDVVEAECSEAALEYFYVSSCCHIMWHLKINLTIIIG